MKLTIRNYSLVALSALLISVALQAANVVIPQNQNRPAQQNQQVAPFTGSAKAAGVIKTNIKQELAAYDLTQPDLNKLQQIVTQAQSIKPGVTNGYTQKEWDSLTLEFINKTGININNNRTLTIPALTNLLGNLKTTRGGAVVTDALAVPTTKGAQDFQAAWQQFLSANSLSGAILPNAQQEASQRLGITIDALRGVIRDRNQEIVNDNAELNDCYQTSRNYLNALTQIKDAAIPYADFSNTIQEKNLLNLPQSLAKDMQTVSRKLRANGKDKTDTDNVMQTLKDLNTNLQKQLEAKNSSIADLEKNLTESQQRLQASLANDPQSLNAKLNAQVADLEQDLEKAQAELTTCLANDQTGTMRAQEGRITQLNQENAQLRKENTELIKHVQEMTTHIAELQAALQAEQAELARAQSDPLNYKPRQPKK